MELIKICKQCGARNYFSRNYCGQCGAPLGKASYAGYGGRSFDIIGFLRGLSTTKLLYGLVVFIVLIVGAVVVWQFVPKPDVKGPQLYGITHDSITATSVRIIWYTDEPSSSQVEYGRTYEYGQISPVWPQDDPTTSDSPGVTAHYVIIKPLSQNTTYYFRVKSKDARGNESISQELQTFRTSETLPFYGPD